MARVKMLDDQALGRKAKRYARSVVETLCMGVVPDRGSTLKSEWRHIEGWIEAAYFNGHRSGEARMNGRVTR